LEQRALVEATDFSPAKPLVVAVIPAYNEERFIASVVITALSYADAVIVVDDGSTDRTASLARVWLPDALSSQAPVSARMNSTLL
jgi:cellulose synthase/poly-beta-1,6-N-acetylglucosamine synthase-like glycosyltransferase